MDEIKRKFDSISNAKINNRDDNLLDGGDSNEEI